MDGLLASAPAAAAAAAATATEEDDVAAVAATIRRASMESSLGRLRREYPLRFLLLSGLFFARVCV